MLMALGGVVCVVVLLGMAIAMPVMAWMEWRDSPLQDVGDRVLQGLLSGGILVMSALCFWLASLVSHDMWTRMTITPVVQTVTVEEWRHVWQRQTHTMMVGKTIMVTSSQLPATEFTTLEIPGEFQVSGHRPWSVHQRVVLSVYYRHGQVVSYDFVGENY
jgi:hypothetical protein